MGIDEDLPEEANEEGPPPIFEDDATINLFNIIDAATLVPVFEQLEILRKRVRYWKLQDREGKLMLKVDLHVASRVLDIPKNREGDSWGSLIYDRDEWHDRDDFRVSEALFWNVDLDYMEGEYKGFRTLLCWIQRNPYSLEKTSTALGLSLFWKNQKPRSYIS